MHTGTAIVAKPIEGTKRPQPHPPHTRGTFHCRLQPLYTEKHKVSCSGFLPQHTACNIHAAIPVRSVTTTSRNAWNYADRNNHCCKTHRRNQSTPAAPVAHTRYLSLPAGATLHGKTQGFVLWLHPHDTRHVTFMQPLQCISQHPVANLRLSTHVATSNDESKQPFQCNLQLEILEPHRTTHTDTTTRSKTHRRNNSRMKRPQPHPPHTRGTFHRRLQPLYTEKHKVSCSGFLPTTHGMQHSCSHSNAICNHSFKKRIELRRQEQPLYIEGTKRPQPHPPHTRGTFHCRLQPLYTENYKVSYSGFLPTTHGMQHSCSHSNAIYNHSFKKRIELRTQEQRLLQNT